MLMYAYTEKVCAALTDLARNAAAFDDRHLDNVAVLRATLIELRADARGALALIEECMK